MSEPIVLDEASYWQLLTRSLQHQRVVEQAQRHVNESTARFNALMTAKGLDPTKAYRFHDETLTATVVTETRET